MGHSLMKVFACMALVGALAGSECEAKSDRLINIDLSCSGGVRNVYISINNKTKNPIIVNGTLWTMGERLFTSLLVYNDNSFEPVEYSLIAESPFVPPPIRLMPGKSAGGWVTWFTYGINEAVNKGAVIIRFKIDLSKFSDISPLGSDGLITGIIYFHKKSILSRECGAVAFDP